MCGYSRDFDRGCVILIMVVWRRCGWMMRQVVSAPRRESLYQVVPRVHHRPMPAEEEVCVVVGKCK